MFRNVSVTNESYRYYENDNAFEYRRLMINESLYSLGFHRPKSSNSYAFVVYNMQEGTTNWFYSWSDFCYRAKGDRDLEALKDMIMHDPDLKMTIALVSPGFFVAKSNVP